jgi:hypothetical protein
MAARLICIQRVGVRFPAGPPISVSHLLFHNVSGWSRGGAEHLITATIFGQWSFALDFYKNSFILTFMNDFAFSEKSGQYVATAPSRHDLPSKLRAKIHDEAVDAVRNGDPETDNPYSKGCPAYLQWEHSYSEYQEAWGI